MTGGCAMNIRTATFRKRQGWEMDNGAISLFLMAGGGHIARLELKSRPGINPLWEPSWKGLEPWQYKPAMASAYGEKLLAAISGHNLCLGHFGPASSEETRLGLGCHGEAPVARWRERRKHVSDAEIRLTCGCGLDIAGMRVERTLSMKRNACIVDVTEKVTNMNRKDTPFTMCQHVTFGPPFLEPGVTLFDMPATRGATEPGSLKRFMRLKRGADFKWPVAPGVRGSVNLRTLGRGRISDFSAQLMRPGLEHAWFSAVHPGMGLLVAYVWRRADYPWVANWEENRGRDFPPWAGKSLTRGMEFANSPFPVPLREALSMGRFHGEPTFRLLPARGSLEFRYSIVMAAVDRECRGVRSIKPDRGGFAILFEG